MDDRAPAPPAVPATPRSLMVAAVLVGAQGAALLVLGVAGLIDVVPARIGVGAAVAVFFGAYGVLLIAGARALLQRLGWARGPVMLTQLILLGIAWNARSNPAFAVPLAATALACLAAMAHRDTVAALERDPGEDDDA